ECIDQRSGVEGTDLQVTCGTESLRRGRLFHTHAVLIWRRVKKQRFTVRSIADDQLQITGLNDLDLEPRREHVERTARIDDERARHLVSCPPEILGREVDLELGA